MDAFIRPLPTSLTQKTSNKGCTPSRAGGHFVYSFFSHPTPLSPETSPDRMYTIPEESPTAIEMLESERSGDDDDDDVAASAVISASG